MRVVAGIALVLQGVTELRGETADVTAVLRVIGRSGNTVGRRLMDTHRWDTCGAPPSVEHLL